MIDLGHALSITAQAKLLGMSRGAVYYPLRPARPVDLVVMRKLDELYLEHFFMGWSMAPQQLAREGIHAGRRYIMAIETLVPQLGTSKAAPGHKIYPYLLRKLAIERAIQVWALDTTYISMAREGVYLSAVVDVASRNGLAHKVGDYVGSHVRQTGDQSGLYPFLYPRDRQRRSRQRVHGRGVRSGRLGHVLQVVHGRAWGLARQRVRRVLVAQCEVRAGVPEGLRQHERCARRDCRKSGLVQLASRFLKSPTAHPEREVLCSVATDVDGHAR